MCVPTHDVADEVLPVVGNLPYHLITCHGQHSLQAGEDNTRSMIMHQHTSQVYIGIHIHVYTCRYVYPQDT